MQGMGVSGQQLRLSSDTAGLIPSTARHRDDSAGLLHPIAPRSPGSLHPLLPPAPSSRSRVCGKAALAESAFLLPSPCQRFLPPPPLLHVPTPPRAAPSSACPQSSLPRALELDGHTEEETTGEDVEVITARPHTSHSGFLALVSSPPPASLPLRVGNCSDSLSAAAAASSLPSSLFPGQRKPPTDSSQGKAPSPSLPHPQGSPGCIPGSSLRDAASRAPHKAGPAIPGTLPSPHVRCALPSAAKGMDGVPLSALEMLFLKALKQE